ncbi:MFS general substrate transporter [Aspergillus californicus]
MLYATSSSNNKPAGAWRSSRLFIVTVISIAMFSETFLFSFIIPILPSMLHDRLQIPTSNIQFVTSVILSMNALISIVLAPFIGPLSDKWDRKNGLMIWSWIINMVGTFITAWSTTLPWLIVGRLVQTVAGSLIWIAGMAMLGASVAPHHLAKAFGFCTLFVSAGLLSGPALSGALFKFVPYYAMWLSSFLVLLVGAVLQCLVIETSTVNEPENDVPSDDDTLAEQYIDTDALLPSRPGPPHHTYESISKLHKHPLQTPAPTLRIYWMMICKRRVLTALIADTLFAIVISSFEATIPIHVRDVFHWESLEAGMLFLLLQAPSLVLIMPAGWLKDRIGMRVPVTIGFLLMAPSLWLLGVPGNEHFEWPNDRQTGQVIYIMTLVAIGVCRTLLLGFGGIEVLNGANSLAAEKPGIFGAGTGYSRAFAMSNITWKLGMFLGPLLCGMLTESVGYYAMNVVLAILCFMMGIATYVAIRKN